MTTIAECVNTPHRLGELCYTPNMHESLSEDIFHHHAHLIEGEAGHATRALRAVIEKEGIDLDHDPDCRFTAVETFLLPNAEEIRLSASRRALSGGRKIFIVSFSSIGTDAQHALLKTLEEPTERTHFFFIVPRRELLLPTVRSRMRLTVLSGDPREAKESSGGGFLAADIPSRMKTIAPMIAAKDEKKREARESARELLDEVERALLEMNGIETKVRLRAAAEIVDARRYLSGSAPSLRIILEHLALSLPRSTAR